MRLLDGCSRAGAVRLTGMLAVAVAAFCVGASAAAATEVIRTIPVGNEPYAVSSDGTHVWVANFGPFTVGEIEAPSGELIRTTPVGSAPSGVSSDGAHVWVTNNASETATEIEASTSSGVTDVKGNAEGRLFTFNRDISKCGVSATLNEGPASVVYAERNEFPNQLVTKTDVEGEKVAAGGVDLVVSC
jgi:DNA-binding beta-propeller fold protein YncE